VGSRLNDILFFVQNALMRLMGGHKITDMVKQPEFLAIAKIPNPRRFKCQPNSIKSTHFRAINVEILSICQKEFI